MKKYLIQVSALQTYIHTLDLEIEAKNIKEAKMKALSKAREEDNNWDLFETEGDFGDYKIVEIKEV